MKKELRDLISAELFKGKKFSSFKLFRLRLENSSADAIWLLRSYLFWTAEHSHPFKRRRNRIRLERRYGIYCGKDVKIGRGLKLPHPQGIVIGKGAVLGENCTIYQQVTIGGHGGSDTPAIYPTIGKDVILYAGAKVIGAITVADRTMVGANSVLNKSTEYGGGVYVGAPAKKVEKKSTN